MKEFLFEYWFEGHEYGVTVRADSIGEAERKIRQMGTARYMAEHKFSGRISKVSEDGRFAVVTLDSRVEGRDFAVINAETAGRMQLMNGVGRLEKDTRVKGTGIKGPESVRATSVIECAA